MAAEGDEAYRAACRLLDALQPGLRKLPTTSGVITQINNVTAGMRQKAETDAENYKAIVRALRRDIDALVRASVRSDRD